MKYLILLLSIILFVGCGEKKTPESENLTKEKLHSIAVDIQKDFAHLNMQMGDISEEQLSNMNEKIAFLADEIKKLREELPKDDISAEVLKTSHTLYSELLTIYQEAGFDTGKIEAKINKLKTGLDNL
jgi:hypothetical protein